MRLYQATQARKELFKILDFVLQGEKVLIDRNGTAIELKVRKSKGKTQQVYDYRKYIHSNLDSIDQWGWEWNPENEFAPVKIK